MAQGEILANSVEDNLLRELTAAMGERGFTLLSILAVCDEDKSVATFGDAKVTQSVNFGTLLHALAEQILHDANASRSQQEGHIRQAPAHPVNAANLHLCKKHD